MDETLRALADEYGTKLAQFVADLSHVHGVAALVLGGSRARGTHTAQSDVDLGLYYLQDTRLDVDALRHLASRVDDTHGEELVTLVGEWGPWINGGGWLTIDGLPVDLLYRDLGTVSRVIDDAHAGRIEMAYQPGHPQGYLSTIYMGEIAICRPLSDPAGVVQALKIRTRPYPPALKETLLTRFLWEAGFSLVVARKAFPRRDVAYVAGCCFRYVACLMQVLFALNEEYWLNEKGAVAHAASFPLAPNDLERRVAAVFAQVTPDEQSLGTAVTLLEGLIAEIRDLLS